MIKMYGDWMQDDTKIKIWQDINESIDKIHKTFKKALEFTTYKDKRWE